MLTEYEAWKLKDNARHELSVGPGVVSKCAVMLLDLSRFFVAIQAVSRGSILSASCRA